MTPLLEREDSGKGTAAYFRNSFSIAQYRFSYPVAIHRSGCSSAILIESFKGLTLGDKL